MSKPKKPRASKRSRKQEGERLDLLQRGVWADALAGDTKATTTVLRIIELRAKLFGLTRSKAVTGKKRRK